ncbi:MAG: SIR2 family protein [Acidobacteriota bacterium]|nr:SIR2 family protein [Acidobacteriota bacterium]
MPDAKLSAVKPPAALLEYLAEGRCVLFVGAGLSAWSGMPSWNALLEILCQELTEDDPDGREARELGRLRDDGNYLQVAEYCRDGLGSYRFHEILRNTLQPDSDEVPAPHRLLVNLPFAGIVTTNYDALLENSFAQMGKTVPRVLTHEDRSSLGSLLFERRPFVLKAHGDLDREETLVLTARDYREVIHANPAFAEVFSAILLTHSILFIGYSLQDPDFRLLLDQQLTVFDGNVPPRYALMSGLGSIQRDVLWKSASIKVLPYATEPGHRDGPHHQVLRFLKALAAGGQPEATRSGAMGGRYDLEAGDWEAGDLGAGDLESDDLEAGDWDAGDLDGGGFEEEWDGSVEIRAPRKGSGYGAEGEMPPADHYGSGPSTDTPPPPPSGTRGGTSLGPPPEAPASPGEGIDGRRSAAPVPQVLEHSNLSLHLAEGRIHSRFTGDGESVSGDVSARRMEHVLDDLRHAVDWTSAEARRFLRRCSERLAELLDPRVRRALDVLEEGSLLRLETSPELARWPWEWVRLEGDERELAQRLAMGRAPVAITDRARGRPRIDGPPSVLLLADPSGNLPGARDEAHVIAEAYEEAGSHCRLLEGRRATSEALVGELQRGTSDIVHFAGHGWFDEQEAYLLLADDQRLRASELRYFLGRRPPALLVLNTHYSAFIPPQITATVAGAEGHAEVPAQRVGRDGFSETALAAGVGAVVGTYGSVSDAVAAEVGIALHHGLLEGLPVAEALRHARPAAPPGDSSYDPTGLLYALSGYLDLRWRVGS